MMGKRSLVLMLGALLTLAGALVGHSAEQPAGAKLGPNVESKNVINFPLSVKFHRPAMATATRISEVSFSHYQHQAVACSECHHTWDGKSKIESCSTSGCHDNLNRADELSYFKAFHARESNHSCYGCHAKLNASRDKKLKLAPCANNICHAPEKK